MTAAEPDLHVLHLYFRNMTPLASRFKTSLESLTAAVVRVVTTDANHIIGGWGGGAGHNVQS